MNTYKKIPTVFDKNQKTKDYDHDNHDHDHHSNKTSLNNDSANTNRRSVIKQLFAQLDRKERRKLAEDLFKRSFREVKKNVFFRITWLFAIWRYHP